MKQGGDAAVPRPRAGQSLVEKGYAEAHDIKVGDTLQVDDPDGQAHRRRR